MDDSKQLMTLPDEQTFRHDIEAINKFQKIVRATMVDGQDYGVIPGTSKPTLLKPGAEKIAKLLGLSDLYEIVDRQEDWGKPFFRYLVRCKLVSVSSGVTISEGLGECNSMESKYRWRWVWPDDVSDNEKSTLVFRRTKNGGKQYRIDNDDIYSQVNTVLKMAKKRALVDAALSAGRLSEVFTQDIEDIPSVSEPQSSQPARNEHWCHIHNVAFFKRGKMKGYAHPIEGTDQWCNEADIKDDRASWEIIEGEGTVIEQEPEEQQEASGTYIDMDWLKEALGDLQWTDVTGYLRQTYKVTGKTVREMIPKLTKDQQAEFAQEVQDRLDMQ